MWTSEFWTATSVTLRRDGRVVGKLETNRTGMGMAQTSAADITFLLEACNEKEARERP